MAQCLPKYTLLPRSLTETRSLRKDKYVHLKEVNTFANVDLVSGKLELLSSFQVTFAELKSKMRLNHDACCDNKTLVW